MEIINYTVVPSNLFNESPFPHHLGLCYSPLRLRFCSPTANNVFRCSTVSYESKLPFTGPREHINMSSDTDTRMGRYLSLLNSNSVSDSRQIHAQLVKLSALGSNSAIGNKLATSYAKNSQFLDDARKVFGEIRERTVPTYAALMGSYCRSERWEDLFFVLTSMLNDEILPDKYMIPTILKACSVTRMSRIGKMVHGYVIRMGLETDVFVGNALIDLYSNCGGLRSSRRVFDTMKARDVVSWTAMLSAYMEDGRLDEATEIFSLMLSSGVNPDLISWNAIVSGFARNGEIDMAIQYLEVMQEQGIRPNVNTWNGIISGCIQNGYLEDGFNLFNKMLQFPEDPNFITIASILPACAGIKNLNLGSAIHGYAVKHGLSGNIHIEGSLIAMYSKCGRINYAEKIFFKVETRTTAIWNQMISAYVNEGNINETLKLLKMMKKDGLEPDVITYNTLLSGHAKEGQKEKAYELLSEMIQMEIKPNVVSLNVLVSGFQQAGFSYEALKILRIMQSPWPGNVPDQVLCLHVSTQLSPITVTSIVAACADLKLLQQGKEMHGYLLRNEFEPNVHVSSALLDLYVKCNDIDSATKLFKITEDKNAICWNILMAGRVNNKQEDEALQLFYEMLAEGLKPSYVTFVIMLSACRKMPSVRVGRALHGYIIKENFDEPRNTIASALIGMYSDCGSIFEAELVFDSLDEDDVALWNAMMSAYSSHGMSKSAIKLLERMKLRAIIPDNVTFTVLLSACARDGLVDDGWELFNSMEKLYGITPTLQSYTCMVGILASAGLLNEALDLVQRMPYVADACVWATLLQASRAHSNVEVGERAAKALFELEPRNATNFVILHNIYSSLGMWDSAEKVKRLMRDQNLVTTWERSCIFVGTKLHTFEGGDRSHPELDIILVTWVKMATRLERAGYIPLDPVFSKDDNHNSFSCQHTEKLALCFGIISLHARTPILVSKNLRMCIDCHTSAKLISKIDEREIFVKDGSFYHHIKDGLCSCQDRW